MVALTEDAGLATRLHALPRSGDLELEAAETEHSALVESFRPDFVILDGDLGTERIPRFSQALLRDPRAALEGFLLAARPTRLQEGTPDDLLGIVRSFDLEDLSQRIRRTREELATPR